MSPFACTVSGLFLSSRVVQAFNSTSEVQTVTLYQNDTATAMTCNLPQPNTLLGNTASCSDTTHTVSVAAGDILYYAVTRSNLNGGYSRLGISLFCQ